MKIEQPWRYTSEQVVRKLKTDGLRGLSNSEAKRRQLKNLRTVISLEKLTLPLQEPLLLTVLLLVGLAYYFGDYLTASLALLAVALELFFLSRGERLLNRAYGQAQHHHQPRLPVIRDAQERLIPRSQLVPGDLIRLKPGLTPAMPMRIIESQELVSRSRGTDNTLLAKNSFLLNSQTALNQPANMLASGETILGGHGYGLVVDEAEAANQRKPAKVQASPAFQHFGLVWFILIFGFVLLLLFSGVMRAQSLSALLGDQLVLLAALAPLTIGIVLTILTVRSWQALFHQQINLTDFGLLDRLAELRYLLIPAAWTYRVGKVQAIRVAGEHYQIDWRKNRLITGDGPIVWQRQSAVKLFMTSLGLLFSQRYQPEPRSAAATLQGLVEHFPVGATPAVWLSAPPGFIKARAKDDQTAVLFGPAAEVLEMAELQIKPNGQTARLLAASLDHYRELIAQAIAEGRLVYGLARSLTGPAKSDPERWAWLGLVIIERQIELTTFNCFSALRTRAIQPIIYSDRSVLETEALIKELGLEGEVVAGDRLIASKSQNITAFTGVTDENLDLIVGRLNKIGPVGLVTTGGSNPTDAAATVVFSCIPSSQPQTISLKSTDLADLSAVFQVADRLWTAWRRASLFFLSWAMLAGLTVVLARSLGWPLPTPAFFLGLNLLLPLLASLNWLTADTATNHQAMINNPQEFFLALWLATGTLLGSWLVWQIFGFQPNAGTLAFFLVISQLSLLLVILYRSAKIRITALSYLAVLPLALFAWAWLMPLAQAVFGLETPTIAAICFALLGGLLPVVIDWLYRQMTVHFHRHGSQLVDQPVSGTMSR